MKIITSGNFILAVLLLTLFFIIFLTNFILSLTRCDSCGKMYLDWTMMTARISESPKDKGYFVHVCKNCYYKFLRSMR